jgi:hypothetical protein
MNGTGLYYLASAADRVFMPPSGMLSLLGFDTTQVRVGRLCYLPHHSVVRKKQDCACSEARSCLSSCVSVCVCCRPCTGVHSWPA